MLLVTMSSFAQPTLVVVTEFSPPHQTQIGNKVGGFSTDIVTMIVNEANMNASISIYPWARAYQMVSRQKNTLIYSLARTPERESLFHWIAPVVHFKLGFVKLAQRDDVRVNNMQQAKHYKIAVQRNDLAYTVLNNHGFDLLLTPDIQNSYHLLLAKKVDLIIDDENYIPAMSKHIGVSPDRFSFIYAIDELNVDGYLAANLDIDPEILHALQQAFLKIKDAAKYKALLEAH